MTVLYKSSWQFCIMSERSISGIFNYSEYDFDEGEKPWFGGSDVAERMQISEKKYTDFNLFRARICELKSLGYKVIFSQPMESEKISEFILKSNDYLKKSYRQIDRVVYVLSDNAEECGIKGLDFCAKKSYPVQTFQNYITPISILLIQGQRQKESPFFGIPNDCLNNVWLFVLNGFLNANALKNQKTWIKTISSQCLISSYTSGFFCRKSPESRKFIDDLSEVVNENPDKIDETVKAFTDIKSEDNAIELLEKYHLTMKSDVSDKPSSLTDAHVIELKEMIGTLNKEIQSSWPYPDKDRKAEKVSGLKKLLTLAETFDVDTAVEKVEEEFSEIRKGSISTRTADLLDSLKNDQNMPWI